MLFRPRLRASATRRHGQLVQGAFAQPDGDRRNPLLFPIAMSEANFGYQAASAAAMSIWWTSAPVLECHVAVVLKELSVPAAEPTRYGYAVQLATPAGARANPLILGSGLRALCYRGDRLYRVLTAAAAGQSGSVDDAMLASPAGDRANPLSGMCTCIA